MKHILLIITPWLMVFCGHFAVTVTDVLHSVCGERAVIVFSILCPCSTRTWLGGRHWRRHQWRCEEPAGGAAAGTTSLLHLHGQETRRGSCGKIIWTESFASGRRPCRPRGRMCSLFHCSDGIVGPADTFATYHMIVRRSRPPSSCPPGGRGKHSVTHVSRPFHCWQMIVTPANAWDYFPHSSVWPPPAPQTQPFSPQIFSIFTRHLSNPSALTSPLLPVSLFPCGTCRRRGMRAMRWMRIWPSRTPRLCLR